MKNFNLKCPVYIDTDPEDEEFFAIFTNEKNRINVSLCSGIGEQKIAVFICQKINEEIMS